MVDTVVVVHVDDKIVSIGGPEFVVVVSVPYTGDAVVLVLTCVPVVVDIVFVVFVDEKIVGIGGAVFVIGVVVPYLSIRYCSIDTLGCSSCGCSCSRSACR